MKRHLIFGCLWAACAILVVSSELDIVSSIISFIGIGIAVAGTVRLTNWRSQRGDSSATHGPKDAQQNDEKHQP